MDRKRLLELAVAELERKKAAILAEIEGIRSELKGKVFRPARRTKTAAAHTNRRRAQTAEARKAQSQRMKKYWAAKRAEQAKSSRSKTTPTAKAETRAKTEAEKRALSQKMKEVWKKRKAAAKKK